MASKSLTGQRVINEVVKCGITHVVWLPDHEAKFMYEAMNNQPGLTLVPMCREGEGVAIAAGLITGGKKAMVLHQNTGLYDSGDSVRALGLELRLPVLLMLGYLGWQHGAPVISSGVYLEPMLDAWHIKHYLLETDDDVEKISTAYKEANETKRPVAVLIANEHQPEHNTKPMATVSGTKMDSLEAGRVIARHRHNAIVVAASHTASREWPQVSSAPDLDIASLPPVMGKGSSYGLGLALAHPDRKVMVLDGDGALLMNLGSLITIANMAPTNLIHFVLENGVYRTTGGQPIPGVGKFNFTGLAKEAGYHRVYEFANLPDLESAMEKIMNETGPILVCLKTQPLTEMSTFRPPRNSDAASLSSQIEKAVRRSSV